MLLKCAIQCIPIALLVVDQDSMLVEMNQQAVKWFDGLRIGESISQKFVSPEVGSGGGFVEFNSGSEGGKDRFQLGTFTYRFVTSQFSMGDVTYQCVSIFDDTEQHKQMMNASGMIKALEAAQMSREKKRSSKIETGESLDDFEAKCMESGSIGLRSDPNSTLICVSAEGVNLRLSSDNFRGYSRKELEGEFSYLCIHPDDIKELSAKHQDYLEDNHQGTPVLRWMRKKHKNGTYVHTEFSGSVHQDEHGTCTFYGIERVLSTKRMEMVVQSVLNQIPCGVVMVDTVSGNIDMCNHHASNWLNISKDKSFIDCLDLLRHQVLSESECDKLISTVKNCESGDGLIVDGVRGEAEVTITTKKGKVLSFIGRSQSEGNMKHSGVNSLGVNSDTLKGDQLTGSMAPSSVLWIVNDITALSKAMDEKTDSILQFMRCTSHDMRTPMQAIALAAYSINEEFSGNESIHEDVHTIISSSAVLETIVSNILEFKTINSTEVTVNLEPLDIKQKVERVVDILSHSTLVSDDVQLSASFSPEIADYFLECDDKLLDRIILNLASNSLKFTTKGKVEVICSYIQDECGVVNNQIDQEPLAATGNAFDSTSDLHAPLKHESFMGGTLCISVKDTGRGMDQKTREKMGEIGFFSGEKGGFGLGTFIVKTYVNVLQGNMNLESEVDFGTTITIRIPTRASSKRASMISSCMKPMPDENDEGGLKEAEPNNHDINSSDVASSGVGGKDNSLPLELRNTTVLVVEDVTINRRLLVRSLEKGGFNVDQAENGAIALSMMLKKKFRTVFMDINMPVMNGEESIKNYWQQSKHLTEHPRFYVLTGNITDADRQMALDCGAHEFLTKPINPKKVIEFASWE